jgi:hypothetical protein
MTDTVELGGSGNEFTETHGLALDSAGNAYVGATTLSADFPTTAGAFQRTYGGAGGGGNYPGDGFVAKISPSGKLVASTFLGGKSGEGIEGIGLDAQGDVYVSGATFSTNFPVTHGAFQASLKGTADLFGSKLSADLGTLLYSTYLGGSGEDYGRTAWADRAGNFYIAGEVRSTNFPTANPMQPKYGGGALDAGLAKFLPISPK